MAKQTIGLYLLLASVTMLGKSLIAATYVTFLMAHGLNLFEVNLTNFVFFTTLFVCEMPTGAIADVFGRKTSFVISCFISSTSLFIYAASTSFWGFALAEAIGAVGMTFSSGAFQAWLVDRLKYHNHNGSLGAVFAREQLLSHGAAIVGAIVGAALADRIQVLPWIIGGVILFVTGLIAALRMKEEYFVRQVLSWKGSLKSMKETMMDSVNYSKKSNVVRFIVLMGLLQYFAIQAPNMQWQPFFSQFLPNKASLGFVFGGISICLIVGSALAPRFLKFIGDEKRALVVLQIGIGVGVMTTVLFGWFPLAIGVFLFHEVMRGLFRPLKDMYLNDNIPSAQRATLISFESMSHHLGGAAGLLFSGFVAEYTSTAVAWILSGGLLAISALWLMKNRKE